MKRVVLTLALVTAAFLTRPVTVSTAVDPALVGQWSSVLPWSAIAVHSHLLNSGRALTWEEGSQASVWDPATGLFADLPAPWVDLLCSGHTFLADGRLITLGGWDRSGAGLGLNEVDIFEPNIQAWIRARPMAFKRWYPTATRLPDGRVLAVSGARNSLTDIVTTPEVYDPATDTWTSLTAAVRAIPMYPFMFVLPDGRVITVGNSEVPNRTQALDLSTNTWTVVDTRSIEGGAAVMFQPGKFMKAGTAADSGDSGLSGSTAFVLDMTQPVPAWTPTGSMAFPRSFHNLTMLPDGTTLVTGGGTDRSAFISSNGVLPAELWSPVSGTWTTLASMVKPRLYHSTALLLPDARVLVAGGGADSGVEDQPTGEIFSPPYLFKGPRPTIASTPSTLAYGATFPVATADAATIASVTLMAPGSVTHGFNMDQRFLTLAFQATPNGLNVVAPATANLAPPGYYMLFIVNSSGVPSVAAFVNLPVTAVPPPTVAVPNVVNAAQAAATTTITGAGLTVGTVTTASSATVPAGSVISQTPIAGTQVATGSAVALIVSAGTAAVAVPNVVNTTQAAATTTITSVGLTVGAVTIAPSATVPAGSVITQTPVAGTQVAKGSAVALVVSSGTGLIAVPNVVNATQAAATATITAAGLTVGAVTTASSATVPAGAVIGQSPIAGAQVVSGSAVALVVSSGPASVSLAVDTAVSVDGSGTLVSPPMSTAVAGELLVAFAASDGPTSSKQTLTVSGAGLTWTLKQRSNTQLGTSEIWTASAPTALVNVTVTAKQATGWFDQSLTVVAFRGAGGTGASAAAGAASGPPSVSLTTTRAGSLVYGVGNDWSAAVDRVVGADQVLVHQWVDSGVGDTFWVQARSAPMSAAGSIATINDTAPTTDLWNLAAVEILTSSAPLSTVPNVAGLTQAAATTAITNAGLTVGAVTTASSTTVPAGSVISQSPVAGTQVARGTAVALLVSSGAVPVATPSVVGLTQGAATTAITNAGLTVGAVTTASSTTVPAGSVISQSPVAGTQVASGGAVALVVSSGAVQPPVALAVDKVVFSDGNGTRVTPPFSTAAAGELLVAFAAADGPQNSTKQTLTVSGAGLAWSLIRRGNTEFGTAEVWTAMAPAALTNATVTATPLLSGFSQSLTIVAFRGADGTGATAGASASTGPSSVSLTTTRAGSLVYAVGNDSVRPVSRTMAAGQTMVHEFVVTTSTQAFWTQSRTAAVTNAGSVATISNTGPSSGRWNLTAVEILVATVPPPSVEVPNVVGLAQAAAASAITGAGLTVGAVTTASSATTPAGSVTGQTPIAGTQVSAGSAVAFVVSSGPSQVATPSVVGLTQAAATSAITGAGLTVGGVTTASSTTVPAGSVISQDPGADAQVDTGSAVSLVVSSGAPQVATPNVAGLTQAAATTAITNAGLTVGAVTTASSRTVASGSVISQDPSGGTQVDTGSAVSLVVSSGVVAGMVPDVAGFTQAAATTAITNAGLTVGAVTTASSTTVASGSVISQDPSGGTQLDTGSAVSLVVSSGVPKIATPNVAGLTQAAATTAITNAGLAVGAVTTVSSTTVASGSVISQDPSADAQVNTGSAVALVVSSGPPEVAAPNVVGLTEAAAASAITGAGLTVGGVTTASSMTVPTGSVISQNPIGGTQVVTGSAVALVVSSGPLLVATPDVVDLTQAAASTTITGAGLSIDTITTAPSTTVPAGSVISQDPIAGTQVIIGSAVALVVSSGPPPALAVDKVVFSDGTGTRVTAPFSTAAAGELLVAFVASDGPGNGIRQTTTVSGAGLPWTLVRRANTQSGTAEIWTATASARLINVTVSATQGVSGGMDQSLTVVAFTGADGVGASVAGSGSRSAPGVSLTTTAAGSLVYGVGNDPIRKIARSPGTNQTIVHQWVDTDSNQTLWVQSRNGPVATDGSLVTVNDIAPTNGDWNLAAVEIVAK
jgi:beta-lactam-binding protein with PASTA domain